MAKFELRKMKRLPEGKFIENPKGFLSNRTFDKIIIKGIIKKTKFLNANVVDFLKHHGIHEMVKHKLKDGELRVGTDQYGDSVEFEISK